MSIKQFLTFRDYKISDEEITKKNNQYMKTGFFGVWSKQTILVGVGGGWGKESGAY